MGRVGLETAQDDALNRVIEIDHDRGRRSDRPRFVLADEISYCLGSECTAPGKQLIHHKPEREDVTSGSYLPSEELLWRHVCGGASLNVFHAANGSEAEVHHPDSAQSVKHDVGGLQIAMDHTAVV